MCFYNESDWCAELHDEFHSIAESNCKCFECNRTIFAGEWRHRIEQQEYEGCQDCDELGDDDDCCDGQHNYGETFDCDICRECSLLLEAIYDLERIEGCPEHARQPSYGELGDVLWDEPHYWRHAIERFPGLIASNAYRRWTPDFAEA